MGGAPSQILPTIWLGGQDVINDQKFFEDRNIQFVLSLGPAAPPSRIPLAGREHINLPDVPSADLSRHFARAVRFIAEARHIHKGVVYIHCAAGISRSTTCLCAYLMTHLGLSFQQTLSFVSSRRRAVCPNEGFTRQLKRFETSKEKADLAEEMCRQCQNYKQIRQRDLDDMYRPQHSDGSSTGTRRSSHPASGHRSGRDHRDLEEMYRPRTSDGNSTDVRRASHPVSGHRSGRDHRDLEEMYRGPSDGKSIAARHANPMSGYRPNRDHRSESPASRVRNPQLSVEQQARQNALNAIRAGLQGHKGHHPELHIGTGEKKGDVGLGWLLGKEVAPPAGKPTASARNHLPVGNRRSSNSQPVPSSRRAVSKR